jgi:hypothetical protein
MRNRKESFYENASFGSHDKLLLVCRGLLTTYEKPTMNSKYEFIVATPVILVRSMGSPIASHKACPHCLP